MDRENFVSLKKVPSSILARVLKTIKEYDLFSDNNVYVSYSGGKDSLFLCIVLRELGYNVLPIIIDIGYNADWELAINNVKQFGFNPFLLDIQYIDKYIPEIKLKINEYFGYVEQISKDESQKAIACTPCFNAKSLMLRAWAEKNIVKVIANGHHGTDAITSFLKSYYMYADRWFNNNEEFQTQRFIQMIESEKSTYKLCLKNFQFCDTFEKISALLDKDCIGTDEPIKQYFGELDIILCRPFFTIYEFEIKEYFHETNTIFAISECFATKYRKSNIETPREIIQRLITNQATDEILSCMLDIIKSSLSNSGFLLFNARNNFSKILGSKYKTRWCVKK